MIFVMAWLVCAIVGGAIASARGANGFAGFMWGLLFGPLGVLVAFALQPQKVAVNVAKSSNIPPGYGRECPFCRSEIVADANVCPHCQRESEAIKAPASCLPGRTHRWEISTLYPGFCACRKCRRYDRLPKPLAAPLKSQ
jgi:hypothetical protein